MGEEINRIRIEKNLSVEEFAKKLNYSLSAVAKILYGQRKPGRNFLNRLKDTFPDVDMNIFFTQ